MKVVENTKWMDALRGKCAYCRKSFPKRTDEWGYGYKGQECCSYSCQRALERADKNSYLSITEREKDEKHKKTEAERELIRQRAETVQQFGRKHYIDEEEAEAIIRMWKAGDSLNTIERKVNRSGNAVRRLLERKGIRIPKRRNGPVTDAQLSQIFKLHKAGMTTQAIAEQLGLCHSTILKYVKWQK